mmetsp:Transcript_11642/g.41553  ORF Transcript_11642/g.41553 Transcript_11642/m.41553 type:complete len:261 (+) Transcript_11642:2273-3055(+)
MGEICGLQAEKAQNSAHCLRALARSLLPMGLLLLESCVRRCGGRRGLPQRLAPRLALLHAPALGPPGPGPRLPRAPGRAAGGGRPKGHREAPCRGFLGRGRDAGLDRLHPPPAPTAEARAGFGQPPPGRAAGAGAGRVEPLGHEVGCGSIRRHAGAPRAPPRRPMPVLDELVHAHQPSACSRRRCSRIAWRDEAGPPPPRPGRLVPPHRLRAPAPRGRRRRPAPGRWRAPGAEPPALDRFHRAAAAQLGSEGDLEPLAQR